MPALLFAHKKHRPPASPKEIQMVCFCACQSNSFPEETVSRKASKSRDELRRRECDHSASFEVSNISGYDHVC